MAVYLLGEFLVEGTNRVDEVPKWSGREAGAAKLLPDRGKRGKQRPELSGDENPFISLYNECFFFFNSLWKD